jgi:AAA15 family ATPase/GTPase
MKITKIRAKNYKNFEDIEVDIKPINILIGKNSAGKSSLLKLFALIIESMGTENNNHLNFTPLGVDVGMSFSDLVYEYNDAKILTLGFEFEEENDSFNYQVALIYKRESRDIRIKSFIFQGYEFESDLDSGLFSRCGSFAKKIEIKFLGIIPNVFKIEDIETKAKLLPLQSLISYSKDKYLSYIGPIRTMMKPLYSFKPSTNESVGYDGRHSPYIFYNNWQDHVYRDLINRFAFTSLNKTEFLCEEFKNLYSGHFFQVLLSHNDKSSNIVNNGFGYTQVFPLIVEHITRQYHSMNGIEIIEQPELHLHPGMSGALIDLYFDTCMNGHSIVILETHSKNLILRLRRRIAENRHLKAHLKTQILYVNKQETSKKTSLDRIHIDNEGYCLNWPEGVFEEALDEIYAIEEAN